MMEKLMKQLIPIILLVLAVCTPIIYAALATISTWVVALVIAWITLAIVYLSLAILKWK